MCSPQGPGGQIGRPCTWGSRHGIPYLKVLLVVSLNLHPQVPPGPLPALGAPQLLPPSSCAPCPHPTPLGCPRARGWAPCITQHIPPGSLHLVVCVSPCSSLNSSHSLLPPPRPQICSPCPRLLRYPSYRLISAHRQINGCRDCGTNIQWNSIRL